MQLRKINFVFPIWLGRKCTNINIEFMKNIFVANNKNLSGINQKREKTYDLQCKRKRQKD